MFVKLFSTFNCQYSTLMKYFISIFIIFIVFDAKCILSEKLQESAILPLSLPFRITGSINTKCPRRCVCSHAAVICTGQGLTTIPQEIPADTIRL